MGLCQCRRRKVIRDYYIYLKAIVLFKLSRSAFSRCRSTILKVIDRMGIGAGDWRDCRNSFNGTVATTDHVIGRIQRLIAALVGFRQQLGHAHEDVKVHERVVDMAVEDGDARLIQRKSFFRIGRLDHAVVAGAEQFVRRHFDEQTAA